MTYFYIILLILLLAALTNLKLGKFPNLINFFNLFFPLLLIAVNLFIIKNNWPINEISQANLNKISFSSLHTYNIPLLSFKLDWSGLIFSSIISFLWFITNLYSNSYLKFFNKLNNNQIKVDKFFFYLSLTILSTICLSLAADLLTMYIFYEILTLVTYPLITSVNSDYARKSAKQYLLLLLIPSLLFLLPAIIMIYDLAPNQAFDFANPVLGHIHDKTKLTIIFILIILGTSKIALPPFHKWLPIAMVAPAPVSGLLHAVAVVKSGLFVIFKVIVFVFGIKKLKEIGADYLIIMASISIIFSSLLAYRELNLKKMLAYSTINQLSYVLLAWSLASKQTIIAGIIFALSHAFAKLTLFLVTGTIYLTTEKTEITELKSIGKALPFNMAAFSIAALSIIGLPPSIVLFVKYAIIHESYNTPYWLLISIAITISSLLSAYYFFRIIYISYFKKGPNIEIIVKPELSMNLAILLTSAGTISLFILGMIFLNNSSNY